MALPATTQLLIVGTGLTTLAVAWMLATWGHRRAVRQLLSTGVPGQATVLALRREGEGERQTRLTLRFVPQGKADALVLTRLYAGRLPLQVGQTVEIRHLARHPSVLVLVAHAEQRIT